MSKQMIFNPRARASLIITDDDVLAIQRVGKYPMDDDAGFLALSPDAQAHYNSRDGSVVQQEVVG